MIHSSLRTGHVFYSVSYLNCKINVFTCRKIKTTNNLRLRQQMPCSSSYRQVPNNNEKTTASQQHIFIYDLVRSYTCISTGPIPKTNIMRIISKSDPCVGACVLTQKLHACGSKAARSITTGGSVHACVSWPTTTGVGAELDRASERGGGPRYPYRSHLFALSARLCSFIWTFGNLPLQTALGCRGRTSSARN